MASPLVPASGNWSNEAARLRSAGYTMPRSPVQARLEAKKVADTVASGSLTDIANRKATADMRRARMAANRGASMGMTRTASDMMMALPKMRLPGASLVDKGIPINVSDPKELIEIRRWARLFYSTHDLIPLLIDIYARFPVVGLEFQCKDPSIEKFYTSMFLDELNYEEFLPECIGREYFVAGEVTTLAHFDESLGMWTAEEILNPDHVAVSKSLFVQQERVQLLVKEMVEGLRNGPMGRLDADERPSERLERNWEYKQLARNYPEILEAAARDDGLDIDEAVWSRLVNKANPWDNRGTPFLLRSFRTLLMEESLNAAQDAVADRLYSPMVLATMGIENMGDGEPWIPSQAELDNLRDDMQTALSADFKLLVHNLGVEVQSVFGRESVPNFDSDYDRIDAKLMQAWGIGQALIMGGTGAGGTYASSALNREVCELLMKGFQKKVIRHMRKRMEVIAEAQEHFDYELKGGLRVPLYREIVEDILDDDGNPTGEQRIVRAPKLLIPEVKFDSLNLRDEATERAFIGQLKAYGVPVSDKSLAVNIEVDFEQELEREAEETVKKGLAKAQAFAKMQKLCDAQQLPYPPELVAHLQATLQLRQGLAQTDELEDQAKQMDIQTKQMMPAGQLGVMPGYAAPPPEEGVEGQDPGMGAMPPQGALPPGSDMQSAPPMMGSPGGYPMAADPSMMEGQSSAETPVNRSRPVESDEQRANAPRAASATQRWAERVNGSRIKKRSRSKFEIGPSSRGHSRHVTPEQVEAAVRRREMYAKGAISVSQLVDSPDFYRMINMTGHRHEIQADWPEIRAGGAKESADLLKDMVEQYVYLTGDSVVWD
jgi:hypothetical protein